MREESDFAEIDETSGAWCPLCGEWEEDLDLLVYAMCACCEAKLGKVFDDNE